MLTSKDEQPRAFAQSHPCRQHAPPPLREIILTPRCHIGGPHRGRLRPSRCAECGGGSIKAILWTAILIYGAFVAYKIIPAYVAEYQLSDKMQEQARFAVVNRYSEEQIRDNIFKVVQDLEIPVKKEQIKVVDTQDVVKISMEYTIPVDLLVYHIDLHFTPASENKSL